MPLPRRLPPHAWIATLLLALGFLAWTDARRAERLEHLGALTGPPPAVDAASPTGYAGGLRMLIAPGHNDESYQWIAQTQQMIATRAWRLRHVGYDNAPNGRAVASPSLYRWWLAAAGWTDHEFSGRPTGLAVEHAATWADPALLALFVVGATLLARRRFGALAAAILPLVAVVLYPLGGSFLPGAPDNPGLGGLLAAAAALALLAGVMRPDATAANRRWFIFAGVLGGLGLWLNVRTTAPLLLGLGAGALAALWLAPRREPLPWRAWGTAGATTTLLAWLGEYAPAYLDLAAWRLTEVHALYALAWMGGAEWLARASAWRHGGRLASRKLDWVVLGLATLALAALPGAMLVKDNPGFLAANTFAFRLSPLGENTEAGNFATWMVHEGGTLRLLAVGLPLLALVPAAGALLRRATPAPQRFALVLVLGPVLVCLAFACMQLSWWSTADALLLVLLVGATADIPAPETAARARAWSAALVAVALLPGAAALLPPRGPATEAGQFTKRELQGVVERDFAHWLARRAGPDGAIVLAPPDLAASLLYHGGLRVVGSAYPENDEGFRGSVRLASAIHADEAMALARQRNLTHIIVPSWENFLDEYARLGGTDPEHNLMAMIHRWLAPRWLRPVPYYLPNNLPGFEDERLLVFEMTEVQDQAASLSRLTEYFLDMGQFELAGIAGNTLAANFGADLGAQVARARVAIAQRDRAAFAQSLQTIGAALRDGGDDSLAWDRRVSLSLVLAEGRQLPPARTEAQRCLDEMGELDLRGLSESTLFRFLALCKALDLKFPDAHLHDLAKTLVPPPLRAQL